MFWNYLYTRFQLSIRNSKEAANLHPGDAEKNPANLYMNDFSTYIKHNYQRFINSY